MRFGLVYACGFDHAVEYAQTKRDKQRSAEAKKAERELRQSLRDRKDKLKTRRDLMKIAQREFNAYIRARAIRFGHVCISSGKPLTLDKFGGAFDCGHFRSVGSAPHLRFNMNNAWGQCKQDNQFGSGAYLAYRKGLIERIGLEKVEALEDDNSIRKFDAEYLGRVIRIFRRKRRNIEKWGNTCKQQ